MTLLLSIYELPAYTSPNQGTVPGIKSSAVPESSLYVIRSHQEEREREKERESLTRLFTSGPPSSPGEKGGVSVSVTQSLAVLVRNG